MKNKNIGFVGVGRMGANIARHLKDQGYLIASVYDTNETVAKDLAAELSTTVAITPAQVAAAADIIFTVVPDDAAMQAIFTTTENGLLNTATGKTFINTATLSPTTHESITKACTAAGANALEAAMASSIPQARQGTLYLMIGGDKNTFEANKPLLEEMSSNLQYIGPAGSAAKVKALVNMVMNINTAGLAEGLGLGEALGLDLNQLKEIFSQTGANSRVLETDSADMIDRDHDCYFSAAHAAKDSGIANALATEANIATPLSLATEVQYRKLIATGKGNLDKSAVAELIFQGRNES